VVVLKGGKSETGAQAAISHTASLAGNYRVAAGALAHAGVYEAQDFKQLVDFCRTLALHPPRRSRSRGRIAVITFSGASGIVSSDFMEEQGLSVAELSEATKIRLGRLFPQWMPVADPVDIWPAIEQHSGTDLDIYSLALEAVLDDPGVDAVLVHSFSGYTRIRLNLEEMSRQSRASGKPVLLWLLGRHEEVFQARKRARDLGLLVFQELHRAVECLSILFQPSGKLPRFEGAQPVPAPSSTGLSADLSRVLEDAEGPQDEWTSKRILQAFGIPSVEEAVIEDFSRFEGVAARMGFPLVMKGLQPGVVHKTEHGLIVLNIRNPQEAGESFERLMERMNGNGSVLLQKQVQGGVELILGAIRDPQFGPCVMIGVGGVLAHLVADTVFAPAPLGREEALDAIGRLRTPQILDGFRGSEPVDRNVIAALLVNLGNVMIGCPRIREIDINPVLATGNSAVAVDATVVLGGPISRTDHR